MTETERKTLVVDESGAGDYRTLTEAVAACAATPDEPVRFYIRHGIYEERPFIELADYVIEGEYRNATVITASVGGRDPWPGEVKTGTFRSATLFLGGGRAVVRNLTVQNNAGDGAKAGQALAVYADASRVLMENVNLYGNQDTLFTAPLPLQEREQNGFRGPRENTPRLDTKQYYRDCEISGNIDFIFGGANAVFDHCRIVPVAHRGVTSYIAAASTPQGKPGYLFANCTVQGNSPAGSVYLGRPWRQYARVYWLDCDLSDEIIPLGWDNWSDPANEETVHFGEYGSKGPGAPKASPARAGYAALNDEASAQEMRAMLAEFRADFGAEA